jgi:muconolactone delta-isomerase
MNQYMVEIDLPPITQEFMSLVPAQKRTINRLMADGSIESYTLSLDSARLWVVILAQSEQEVHDILDVFPIMPYCDAEVSGLKFHNAMSRELPVISLN